MGVTLIYLTLIYLDVPRHLISDAHRLDVPRHLISEAHREVPPPHLIGDRLLLSALDVKVKKFIEVRVNNGSNFYLLKVAKCLDI